MGSGTEQSISIHWDGQNIYTCLIDGRPAQGEIPLNLMAGEKVNKSHFMPLDD